MVIWLALARVVEADCVLERHRALRRFHAFVLNVLCDRQASCAVYIQHGFGFAFTFPVVRANSTLDMRAILVPRASISVFCKRNYCFQRESSRNLSLSLSNYNNFPNEYPVS